MSKVRIKCPECGAVLEAVDDAKNLSKTVTCPNCHKKRRFIEFKKINPTDLVNQGSESLIQDETELIAKKDYIPGSFLDKSTGISYELSEGLYTVGRKPTRSPSKADIPIITSDQGMSRIHMKVTVTRARDGRFHVYVSNADNINPTYINGIILNDGDVVGIANGDILKLCETELEYIGTPINDETELTFKKK